MKIVRKEKYNITEFGKLTGGDCFEYRGEVYIKAANNLTYTTLYLGREINCFNFSNNEWHCISPSELVRPLNMELREV